MQYSAQCINCMIGKQYDRVKHFTDEDKKSEFMKSICRIIAESDETANAPYITSKASQSFIKIFGDQHEYTQAKKDFNTLMLSLEDEIWQSIQQSNDSLYSAILYAMAGNYIDFGAAGNVKKETLLELLFSSQANKLSEAEYTNFKADLAKAKRLVILLDNCGEIVMDKLLIKIIMQQYPDIKIDAIVRGGEILNDCTMDDAHFVGLTDIVNVTPNGTLIPGTQLNEINEHSSALIHNADIIISKGQGNFESLHGCGLNIYYMFLCKCDWFVHIFRMDKNSGIFCHENNIITYV